jgi:23S rRNA (uracil1939-C5)-methyltransferase
MSSPVCAFHRSCSGCSLWGTEFKTQSDQKIDSLLKLEPPKKVSLRKAEDRGLRDRLDFQFQNEKLGLYSHAQNEIIDLPECLQLSPALQNWLGDFRKLNLSFAKASVRLRVSPKGVRGLWFDLPNLEVQKFLLQDDLLAELSKMAIVEIGQRKKRLIKRGDKWTLSRDPVPFAWSQTRFQNHNIELFHSIMDFSQPGHAINQVLLDSVIEMTPKTKSLIDWGAGSGNLSVALLNVTEQVLGLENQDFHQSWEHIQRQIQDLDPAKKINFQAFDFNKDQNLLPVQILETIQKSDTWVIDPSRPGAGKLLDHIGEAVKHITLVSCSVDGLTFDAKRLLELGWTCEELRLIEMFPQTRHGEWVSGWR